MKDKGEMRKIFDENRLDCVIQFAGLKAVGESVQLKAVEYAAQNKGTEVFNLGTGTPYSILEIINAFEKASGVKINYEIGPRRAGDLPEFCANADKAAKVLGWHTTRTLEDMCKDTWKWQSMNPNGYRK